MYHNGPEDSKTKLVEMRRFDTDINIMVEYMTPHFQIGVKLKVLGQTGLGIQ